MRSAVPLLLFVALLGGCSSSFNTQRASTYLQTGAATAIEEYGRDILGNLEVLRQKLEAGNPAYSNPKFRPKLISMIKLYYPYNDAKSYKEHFREAFDRSGSEYRNDALLLGILGLIYETFELQEGHKFSALSYDGVKLKEAHKLMQIVSFQVRNAKDETGSYLFATWQSEDGIPNCTFESTFALILYQLEKSLKIVGEEPETLGVKSLGSLLYLLIL